MIIMRFFVRIAMIEIYTLEIEFEERRYLSNFQGHFTFNAHTIEFKLFRISNFCDIIIKII